MNNVKQQYYTKFVNVLKTELKGFELDKKNSKMSYYLKDDYGIFIPRRLLEGIGLIIITYKDLSIGYIEFDDFPFSKKPQFRQRRKEFLQTINSIIDTHKNELEIPWKKINSVKHKLRTFGGNIFHSASFICRRGFLL